MMKIRKNKASLFRSHSDEDKNTENQLVELESRQTELTEQIIFALSSAVEAKDRYTNGHSNRVALYAAAIAKRLGWDEDACRRVFYTGLLHDVGKIRISDAIINKKDRLTESEYAEMKLHTLAGYYILKEISAISDFAIGARWHHERYDGTGYPNGLSGENIPIISRIVCVADAYDAMTSSRSYSKLLTQSEVRREIENGLGTQFDPQIGRIMLELMDEDKDYQLRQPEPVSEYVILAIDDDPMVLKLLEFVFKKENRYRLITSLTGDEGLAYLADHAVNLVLLDVEMPGLNGFEVLERIRKDRKNLPVIFMTGEKDMGIIQKAEKMGVSDYLTKPIVPHMLNESIQNVLLADTHRIITKGYCK